jgi:lipid-A-disaccharide synthase
MLYHADAAVVTSGTATLETALFNVPQVVVYRASSLTYQIAKKLIKVDYISLVNLIAGQEVVKELIQNQFNPDNIIAELNRIFNKSERWESIIEGYTEVRQNLGNNNASNETARQILNYLAGSNKT